MIVHQFWYSFDQKDCDSATHLRALNIESIRSILKHHPMFLWSYQTFANVPHDHDGFELRDCNELLPYSEFQYLLREKKHHIAHISCYIRVLALQKFGGWWLDSDTIVLRPLPVEDPYYFATLPSKRVGGGWFHYEKRPSHWANAAHFEGLDGKDEFQNTPFFVKEKDDPWIAASLAFIKTWLPRKGPMKWRININKMQDLIIQMGLQNYVHPPIAFCPIPFWMRDQPVKTLFDTQQVKFGAIVPTVNEILSKSYCIQFFFMSSEKEKTAKRDDGWLKQIRSQHPDSLFNKILSAIS